MRKNWTPEEVKSQAETIARYLGHFPSNTYLRSIGRNDLAVQITRHGGFLQMASEIGVPREHSDSDTGWAGEKNVAHKLEQMGYLVEGGRGVRSPYDILLDQRLRVDVKSAKYHEYGASTGWFYRIGKYVQSDIVILHQLDTLYDYVFFWWEVGISNMTLSKSGGKYAHARGAYWKIKSLLDAVKSAPDKM